MFSRGRSHTASGVLALLLSGALLWAACGGDDKKDSSASPAQTNEPNTVEVAPPTQEPGAVTAPEVGGVAGAPEPNGPPAASPGEASPATPGRSPKAAAAGKSPDAPALGAGKAPGAAQTGGPGPRSASAPGPSGGPPTAATPPAPAKGPLGASDTGVTAEEIHLGSVSSVSSPMSRYIVNPVTRAAQATINSINDTGGVLGRKLRLTDCDDGADVARFRACYGKLVHEKKVFSLVTAMTFGSDSVHGDLARDRIPWIGDIGWYGSSWTDPWMIPMYHSAIADGSAIAEWVAAVPKPKKVGILHLNTPEMKAAAGEATRVLKGKGIEVVRTLQQELGSTDESPNVLQMRAADVDHIIHLSWPPPVVKFFIDAAQQGYWPDKGVSGNHLVAEAVAELVGKWPLNRWWNSSTYQVWGPEYDAVMRKYDPGLVRLHHHNTQTAYIAMRLFREAAQEVGPNLTRDALMKVFESREWDAGPGLGVKFLWKSDVHDTLRCNYMFKYTSVEVGSYKVFTPDPTQFRQCGSLPQRPLQGRR